MTGCAGFNSFARSGLMFAITLIPNRIILLSGVRDATNGGRRNGSGIALAATDFWKLWELIPSGAGSAQIAREVRSNSVGSVFRIIPFLYTDSVSFPRMLLERSAVAFGHTR
jgi:hypothetical protein